MKKWRAPHNPLSAPRIIRGRNLPLPEVLDLVDWRVVVLAPSTLDVLILQPPRVGSVLICSGVRTPHMVHVRQNPPRLPQHPGTLFSGWGWLFRNTKKTANALSPEAGRCGEFFFPSLFIWDKVDKDCFLFGGLWFWPIQNISTGLNSSWDIARCVFFLFLKIIGID